MAVQQFLPEILWLIVIFLAPHGKVIYLLTCFHTLPTVVFGGLVWGGSNTNPRETTAWESNAHTVLDRAF